MVRKRYRWLFLVGGIFFLALWLWIVFSMNPHNGVSLGMVHMSLLPFFFFFLFLSVASITYSIFLQKTRSVLIALCVTVYLLLRLFGFTQIFFGILLVAFFTILGFLF